MSIKKVAGALKWYCESCGDEIDLTLERDSDADVGGFIISGFHIHMGDQQIDLPPLRVYFDDMADFLQFAEVMREVREDVSENE